MELKIRSQGSVDLSFLDGPRHVVCRQTSWQRTLLAVIIIGFFSTTYSWAGELAEPSFTSRLSLSPAPIVLHNNFLAKTQPTGFLMKLVGNTADFAKPAMESPEPCITCSAPIIPGATWNYILDKQPKFTINADSYDIDGFISTSKTTALIHAKKATAICYISAGTWEKWRPDAKQFPAQVLGKSNHWPGEKWLDIRQTEILLPIMQARIAMCKNKGFDAIELDNVDGFANKTGFPINAADQAYYNSLLANIAHQAGLWVGLKNDLDQIQLLLPYFDFAISEQCFQFNECTALIPFIQANKAVLNVEYTLKEDQFCQQAKKMHFSSIIKTRELTEYVRFCR